MTPHSDSLEALLNDYANAVAEHAIHEGSHSAERKVRLTRAALLSRLETLTRERGAYPEVLAENEKLTVENESLYRRLSLAESENARMVEVLQAACEVSGEAAPPDETWSIATTEELLAANAAAPTPHSDSLDLEAIQSRCGASLRYISEDLKYASLAVEVTGGIALKREFETYRECVEASLRDIPALLSRLETMERWYRDAIRLLANAESENARMAEVLNPAQLRNIATGLEKVADRGYRLSADQVSEYRTLAASLVALAARASRTQSSDATTEKK